MIDKKNTNTIKKEIDGVKIEILKYLKAGDELVLCVVRVVTVPGRDPDVGPHAADVGELSRSGDARWGGRADLLVDRQREDRDGRPRRWYCCP